MGEADGQPNPEPPVVASLEPPLVATIFRAYVRIPYWTGLD